MKTTMRVLVPFMVLAVFVLLSVGIAFARELNTMGLAENNHNLIDWLKIGPSKYTSDKPIHQSSKLGDISTSHTNPITSTLEMEITGTVEIILTDTWTVSGQAFAVTPDTEIDGHIAVGDKVKVELYMSHTNVLTASQIEYLFEDKEEVTTEFTGTVVALTAGLITIDNHILKITPETEMEGNVVVGAKVKVEALVNQDGTLTAKQIELLDNNDEEDNNDKEDDNDEGECDEEDCENQQGGDQNHQGQCHEDHCGDHESEEHDGYHESDPGSHHDGGDD